MRHSTISKTSVYSYSMPAQGMEYCNDLSAIGDGISRLIRPSRELI